MLKDKPPSSGTCKFELRTHLSPSNLEINKVATPPEIGVLFAEGVGSDNLSGVVQRWSSMARSLPFQFTCGEGFSTGLGGGINRSRGFQTALRESCINN